VVANWQTFKRLKGLYDPAVFVIGVVVAKWAPVNVNVSVKFPCFDIELVLKYFTIFLSITNINL